MEPLFKTITKYNLKEYKKFCKVFYWKAQHILPILILVEVLFAISYMLKHDATFLFVVIFFPIFLILLLNYKIKRVYNSSKMAHDLEVNFEFYNDYFMKKDRNGETKIEYSNIHKIIGTKTHFYIMIAENQGYILVKENFPKGLEDFIKNISIKNK